METKAFPTINMKATGRQIARLRTEKGLSVRDLQGYFGFGAPQAIYKWQNGETLPSVDNLVALSAVFGVSIDTILVTGKQNSSEKPEGSVFLRFFTASGRNKMTLRMQALPVALRGFPAYAGML